MTPNHIAVDHNGEILILDSFVLNPAQEYSLQEKLESKSCFIAPEELTNLDNHWYQYQPPSDLFCLGLIFLHAITLKSLYDLYDYEHATFSYLKLNLYLAAIKEKYNDSVYEVISILLNESMQERITIYNHFGMGYRYYITANDTSL